MTRTTTAIRWLTCTLLAVGAAGCAAQNIAQKLGDGLETQFQQKGAQIEQAINKVGDALATSASRTGEKIQQIQDLLVSKYEQYHTERKLVFFEETAPKAAAAAKPAAAGAAAAAVAAPALEIKSDLLSERTLEHRGLRLLWKLALDGSAVRLAQLEGGELYVVTWNNQMYCIDADSGLTRWIYDLGRRPDGPPGFSTDYVVISAADVIRVIDRRAGRDKWRFDTNIQPASRPFCDEHYFVFGTWDGKACGFQYGDTNPRWVFRVGDHVFLQPTLIETTAYGAADDGSFTRFNTSLRVTSGNSDLGGRPVGGLIGTKDAIYTATDNFEVLALSPADGSRLWTNTSSGRPSAGPWLSAAGNVLYYAARDDAFYALTASTGKTRWRFPDGIQPVGATEDALFVLKSDGALCKLDAATGKPLWSEPTAPFVTAVENLKTRSLFFLSADGQVFAVAPKK